uniref:Uncharacterized protein n=1 Tax=Mucochytrium quahogii TaxID=96639 RepID=A0A7S2RLH8_9STRA|mmetsp:Transcript_20690/g.33698  ORF Transcript_20690/g.33698 Transcript_20690/m.33698 type:complete len:771 (-) Transcript_20690:379-2691(-)
MAKPQDVFASRFRKRPSLWDNELELCEVLEIHKMEDGCPTSVDVTPSTRANDSLKCFLQALNSLVYMYAFYLVMAFVLVLECVRFFQSLDGWTFTIYRWKVAACVCTQLSGIYPAFLVVWGFAAAYDRHILTHIALDVLVWVVTSVLSTVSIIFVDSDYISALLISILVLRLVSYEHSYTMVKIYLAGGELGTLKLHKTFFKAYRPFAQQRFSFIALVLLSIWIAVANNLKSFFSGRILDAVINKKSTSTFVLLIALFAFAVGSVPAAYFIQAVLLGSIGGNATSKMQRQMLNAVAFGDSSFAEDHPPGKLANTFSGSLKQLYLLWDQTLVTRIMIPGFNIVAVLIFVGTVNVPYMLFCIGVLPLVVALKVIQIQSMKSAKEMTKSFGFVQGRFENVVEIQNAVKASPKVTPILDHVFNQPVANVAKCMQTARTWAGAMGLLYTGIGAFLIILTTWLFYSGLRQGRYTEGQVIQVVGYIGDFGNLVGTFGRGVQYVAGGTGDIEDVFEIIENTKMENREKGARLIGGSKSIIVKHVQKRCPNMDHFILDINHLHIRAGTMCSVLGTSGAGKSTLLHCLARFTGYDRGEIYLDGQEISETSLNSYRDQVAVVFQDTMVLDDTIAENISFGRNLPQHIIEKAAQDAEIHEFIETLPLGYHSIIGNNSNTNLSGGQLQRIAGLARAFAGEPKILLLDEATSSLDSVSEHSIFETIKKMKGCTTIVSVTHRQTTAIDSDLVIYLDKGRIVKSGTYNQVFGEESQNDSWIQQQKA